MSKFLGILFFLITVTSEAQLKISGGTSLIINSGTIISFDSADTLEIESGAFLQNNGQLNLPFDFFVKENSGYPVFGSGFEKIIFYSNAVSEIKPANLGFSFLNFTSGDTLIIKRYHDTLPGMAIPVVKRYFRLTGLQNNQVNILNPKIIADTTEYGSPENTWHFIGSDLSTYVNYGKDSCGAIYSFLNDTVSGYGYFSLSPFNYQENAGTTSIVCQDDTIIINITILGAFENNSLWIAELSDELGNFVSNNFDSTLLNNNNLNFNFPTTGLLAGNNYQIRIREQNSNWLITLFPFEIDSVPLPDIQVSTDTLFVQNYPSGNVEWYLDGNLLAGENDTFLIVTANGNYSAVFVSNNNCMSGSDYNFTTFFVSSNDPLANTTLFPNPATDLLTVNHNRNHSEIKIFNSIGQCVYSSYLNMGKNQLVLDREKFKPGIYLLQIDSQYLRLIVQ